VEELAQFEGDAGPVFSDADELNSSFDAAFSDKAAEFVEAVVVVEAALAETDDFSLAFSTLINRTISRLQGLQQNAESLEKGIGGISAGRGLQIERSRKAREFALHKSRPLESLRPEKQHCLGILRNLYGLWTDQNRART
jgi:hypothetical protein